MSTELLSGTRPEAAATQILARSGLYHPSQTGTNTTGCPQGPDRHAVFSAAYLQNHLLEIDGWSRKLGVTLAHLAQAQKQISAYEDQLAIQKQRIALLEELATSDELTGLKNRRGFYDAFLHEVQCCDRGSSKGGVLILIDLDNFKTINDTYGHAAGDAVLKLVGRTLRHQIRKTDSAVRMGGDEFVLIMANTTQLETRAQAIGWQLNNLSLAWYGDIIPVRASVGIKGFGAGAKVETILEEADSALYNSKADRRNSGGRKPAANGQGGKAMIGQMA